METKKGRTLFYSAFSKDKIFASGSGQFSQQPKSLGPTSSLRLVVEDSTGAADTPFLSHPSCSSFPFHLSRQMFVELWVYMQTTVLNTSLHFLTGFRYNSVFIFTLFRVNWIFLQRPSVSLEVHFMIWVFFPFYFRKHSFCSFVKTYDPHVDFCPPPVFLLQGMCEQLYQ